MYIRIIKHKREISRHTYTRIYRTIFSNLYRARHAVCNPTIQHNHNNDELEFQIVHLILLLFRNRCKNVSTNFNPNVLFPFIALVRQFTWWTLINLQQRLLIIFVMIVSSTEDFEIIFKIDLVYQLSITRRTTWHYIWNKKTSKHMG